jgi:glycosyltransferase involved in cell wall biosynthesis
MDSNVFIVPHINVIGGVEAFLYYIAKKYKARDITVYYRWGDHKQLDRLEQLVRVKQLGGKIKCKRAFFAYDIRDIDDIEAEEYIQIIHADYKEQHIKPNLHPKITKYYAVSKTAADSFTEPTGIECDVCHIPIKPDKRPKPLLLLSATRLTKEKGKERMERLARILDSQKVPYKWLVFTNDTNAIDSPNVIFCKPDLNVVDYMPLADWFIQLSDSEAYCVAACEANLQGVPVLMTDLPMFHELGLQGITLPLDFDDVPDLTHPPKVDFKLPTDKWSKMLTTDKSTYKPTNDGLVRVTAIRKYSDIQLNRLVHIGERLRVTPERAAELIRKGVCE